MKMDPRRDRGEIFVNLVIFFVMLGVLITITLFRLLVK
jgi:hypothetical protein